MAFSFKINRSPVNYIWDFHIPYNAFYGQDSQGFYINSLHKKIPFDGQGYNYVMKLYRFNCQTMEWSVIYEYSKTVARITSLCDKYHLWDLPVKWYKAEDTSLRACEKQEKQAARSKYLQRNGAANIKKTITKIM